MIHNRHLSTCHSADVLTKLTMPSVRLPLASVQPIGSQVTVGDKTKSDNISSSSLVGGFNYFLLITHSI